MERHAAQDAGQDGGQNSPPPPPPPPPLVEGPLAGLPSAPGPHIAQIQALGDNKWMKLESPTPDPVYGSALGRAWGGRALILAPEFRGAFFMGEGEHAYVKPDGYAGDDLWFYDIQQNRWLAVYPGLHIASFNDRVASGKVTVDKNADVVDEKGNPLPIHTLIHAWDFLTYDTNRHQFAWLAGSGMGRYFLPGESKIDAGVTALEEKRKQIASPPPMSPWYYDTVSGAFRHDAAENRRDGVGEFSAFLYLPDRDQFINAGDGGVQLFDPTTRRWTRAKDTGPRPPGYDHGVAYDYRRGRLYMGPGNFDDQTKGAYVYDVATSTWSRPAIENGPTAFRTDDASIMYDDVNDVITVFQYRDHLIYTYKPDANVWSSVPMPQDLAKGVGYPSFHAFYDTQLNAYFLYIARDTPEQGVMWAYRYRQK